MNHRYEVVIIGGGAAGMAAAIELKMLEPGISVAIIEKNDSLGRKIRATGNGRCNITNTAAEGFTGIAVCCLANNSPLGAIFGATFLAYLTVGGNYMQIFGFQREIVSVITSVIIYFAAFSLFLRQILNKILSKQQKEINKVTGEELK